MIQRIQTLLLLIACGLLVSLFFVPMATGAGLSIKYIDSTVLLVLLIVCTYLSFQTIFLYSRRMFQVRVCIFNAIALLALQGMIAYSFFTAGEGVAFSLTAVFPVVAAILVFLAMRYIFRDEVMVRAADRLRK